MKKNTTYISKTFTKGTILFLTSTILTFFIFSCNNSQSVITVCISRTTEKYPLITLADIYKGAFQDYMGPAHIIPDSQSARTYIVKELETADTLVGDYYEPCSWMGNYYRVNLSVNPHYRIIEKNIFEKEILPLLK